MASAKGQADAAKDLAKNNESVLHANEDAKLEAQTKTRQAIQDNERERQGLLQDIRDGHIDPEKFWTGDKNGNGSHSRILSGIGMILAGFNPTNKPNAAVEFLQHQMDQNIEAQKANLNSSQNLLRANLDHFHNIKDAVDMTRLQQNDYVEAQLKANANKAATPQAQAALQGAIAEIQRSSIQTATTLAARQALQNLVSGGQKAPGSIGHQLDLMESLGIPTKDWRDRYFSDLGNGQEAIAKGPVDPATRKEIVSMQKLDNAAKDLLRYSQTHTNLVSGTAEYNFGVTKALAFQQMIREGLLGTVFRESEKPLLEKFVKDNPAGALKSLQTQPQIRAILESNLNALNTLKRSVGLPVEQAQSSSEGEIKTNKQDNKQYKRQGNYYVPVR
jgi:hypothetical protein